MMHFDTTISLGSVLQAATFLVMAVFAWRDLNWRVKNLETWQKEHMIAANARDLLISKLDKILDHLMWQTDYLMGRKTNPPV